MRSAALPRFSSKISGFILFSILSRPLLQKNRVLFFEDMVSLVIFWRGGATLKITSCFVCHLTGRKLPHKFQRISIRCSQHNSGSRLRHNVADRRNIHLVSHHYRYTCGFPILQHKRAQLFRLPLRSTAILKERVQQWKGFNLPNIH